MDVPASAFIDEERTAWRPFEALDGLLDAQLEEPIAAAHAWSGRDLIAHLVAWLGDAVEVAHELQRVDRSEARDRSQAAFAARGDDINAEIQVTWRALPLAEVRRRLHDGPEDLRRAVAGIPDTRWEANEEDRRFFRVYSIGHYEEHLADLEAILAAGRSARVKS